MVINRFGNHTGEETHNLRETSRFTNNNNNNNNNIIIYIGLFSFSFIELFHSSFIAFQLCIGMTWWYLQLHLGPPMNYLYGIAWLAKNEVSVTKTNTPCLFEWASWGLFWLTAAIGISARVIACCCCWRERGSHEKREDMSNNDPSQQKYDCGTLFQNRSTRCTYQVRAMCYSCNLLYHISLTVFGCVISPITLW